MPVTSGVDVISLKNLFRDREDNLEARFLKNLPAGIAYLYKNISKHHWIDVDKQALIYREAAKMLFPKQKNAVYKMHLVLAEKSYSILLRIILLLPPTKQIIEAAPKIWRMYYDTGTSSSQFAKTTVNFIVKHFPELPPEMREATTAHIKILIASTGAKNIRIAFDASNPDKWIWRVKWK